MAKKKATKKAATRARASKKARATSSRARVRAGAARAGGRRASATRARTARKTKAVPARARTKASRAPARPAAARIDALPPIEVETTGGKRFKLSDLKGRNVVIYFYPKDDTPGCTTEGCEIRDHYDEFERLDAVVYGVSRDSLASHERFKAKYGFPFELISDPDETLCRAFDVMREKTLYGRTYLGVERSTFLFDRTGRLRKELRGVKVPGHVDQVLAELRQL
jgi:peroxiredoxin Q/BCP